MATSISERVNHASTNLPYRLPKTSKAGPKALEASSNPERYCIVYNNKESLFYLATPLEHNDFHIISYLTSSI